MIKRGRITDTRGGQMGRAEKSTTPRRKRPFLRHRSTSRRERLIRYDVYGFWCGGEVSVSQSRSWTTESWDAPKVSWSCGGRDDAAEPNDAVAAECFAKAILDAAKVARKWLKPVKAPSDPKGNENHLADQGSPKSGPGSASMEGANKDL